MLSCHCERSAAIQGTPFHYSGLLRCARKDAVHARKDGPTGPWSASVDEIPISAQNFKRIIDMVASKKISSRSAKDLIIHSITAGEDPEKIAQDRGLFQITSSAGLESVVLEVINKNPKVIEDYKAGKAAALEFLVGQCMKAMRGAADPAILRDLLLKKLS